MEEEEEEAGMGKLPEHVVAEIFIRAGVWEWPQISCVSKKWASMFRSESFWQGALSFTYPFFANNSWPGPIPPPPHPKRRFMALYITQHLFASDPHTDEVIGHCYLFLRDQLHLHPSLMPPHSGILHGTLIDQFIACGKSRDVAHDLASRIWLAVVDNLHEDHHTYSLLKRLAQEGDVLI